MLNDYIEISSAKVIDLSFDIDLVIANDTNQGQVVTNAINSVKEFFDIDANELGLTINLSELYSKVSEQPGVLNVVDIRIFNEVGNGYSNSLISQPLISGTQRQLAIADQTIFFMPDEMPQIRYPDTDIRVRVKQLTRANIS